MTLAMASSAPGSFLRKFLDERLGQLLSEADALVEDRVSEAVAEAARLGRADAAEQLNQAVRRLRQAANVDELRATLVDAAARYCAGAATFGVADGAKGMAIRGVSEEKAQAFGELTLPFSDASALAGAVETREPVVAAATASQVSEALVSLLDHAPGARVWVYPLTPGARVEALLYAWDATDAPALELLAQAAAAVWGCISQPPPSPLVSITPVEPPAAPSKAILTWDSLPAAEQQVHLRAQRFARVQTAEMRLYHAADVQAGRARGDLYETLRGPIDTAREAFRKSYFEGCASMVDYLHLELVRTLANDNPELLGKDYPGPLA
jgi:hypothetical protein